MAKNEIIDVLCLGQEVGRVGWDEHEQRSFFQYDPDFLKGDLNVFPSTGILRRSPLTQIFRNYNNETFRGLPPQIADSLPDLFGNIVFKTWLEANNKTFEKISPIEQLAYVANRGMGALEYRPSKELPSDVSIDLDEIISVLQKVVLNKQTTQADGLNSEALLNIFKIGSSAGGARPKILISEHKERATIIPGDLEYSDDYDHYLVKLSLDEDMGYNREHLEYTYYLTAAHLGIEMMSSKLIDDKHFATLRFDRQEGRKRHVLTATGLTGWDFKNPTVSSYENLFELALFLKIPHSEVEQLYKRMVFNVVMGNTDDHLKNHSFLYNDAKNTWYLAPAYDLTYALNPLLDYSRISRAMSINGKRTNINQKDLFGIAENYTVGNPKGIIDEVLSGIEFWCSCAEDLDLPKKVISSIKKRLPVI